MSQHVISLIGEMQGEHQMVVAGREPVDRGPTLALPPSHISPLRWHTLDWLGRAYSKANSNQGVVNSGIGQAYKSGNESCFDDSHITPRKDLQPDHGADGKCYSSILHQLTGRLFLDLCQLTHEILCWTETHGRPHCEVHSRMEQRFLWFLKHLYSISFWKKGMDVQHRKWSVIIRHLFCCSLYVEVTFWYLLDQIAW